ncbi:cupin domain-containing protein [Maribacter sp. X9]|uniref:cupin domain-containing protein n=1 Tax=Maribacter sp. X9 TaxID=3402159 RepID=UPI003AF36007
MKKYTIQKSPFIVPTNDGKSIKEHFGQATDGNSKISVAHMIAPPGWSEPQQRPEFEEYTLILKGKKEFTIDGKKVILNAGESIKIEKHVTVKYANPFDQPCEYIAICLPAFTIEKAHRED